MEEFGKLEERVVLVGVQTDDHDNVEESLDELKELASTAGAVTVGRIIQNRESVHPGTYIGKRKDRGSTCTGICYGCNRNYL